MIQLSVSISSSWRVTFDFPMIFWTLDRMFLTFFIGGVIKSFFPKSVSFTVLPSFIGIIDEKIMAYLLPLGKVEKN